MCSTRAVAESTNCPCRQTWREKIAEHRRETPIVTWCVDAAWWLISRTVKWTGIAIMTVIGWTFDAAWMAITSPPKLATVSTPAPIQTRPITVADPVAAQRKLDRWDYIELDEPLEVNHGR